MKLSSSLIFFALLLISSYSEASSCILDRSAKRVTQIEAANNEDTSSSSGFETFSDLRTDKDSVSSDLKTIFITKDASKYEIDIYKTIKDSPCFPKYFGHVELPENRVELKLEEVIPGCYLEKFHELTRSDLFGAKILVDLLGALITLHSAGFVHGDISPGNIGYNNSRGIWQLFDFDNSRPIKEAAERIGEFLATEKFASKKYMESGIYYPYDDFVGLIKSLHVIFDVLKLQKIYYKATKILWDQIKDPSDPSIENAARIIAKL